tara:strand:- start:230 stop:1735 length:1506 start_codon:yes stop_codon:yes gene_type:complete
MDESKFVSPRKALTDVQLTEKRRKEKFNARAKAALKKGNVDDYIMNRDVASPDTLDKNKKAAATTKKTALTGYSQNAVNSVGFARSFATEARQMATEASQAAKRAQKLTIPASRNMISDDEDSDDLPDDIENPESAASRTAMASKSEASGFKSPYSPRVTPKKIPEENKLGFSPVVFGGNTFIDQAANGLGRTIVKKDVALPSVTFNPLVPESSRSQDAMDKEIFKGVENPYNLSDADYKEIDETTTLENESIERNVRNIVDEAEMLSGGARDSEFGGQDIKNNERKTEDIENQGPAMSGTESGLERGQKAESIIEVEDLSNFEYKGTTAVDFENHPFPSSMVGNMDSFMETPIIRRRPVSSSGFLSGGSDSSSDIMSSISGFTDLSGSDGKYSDGDGGMSDASSSAIMRPNLGQRFQRLNVSTMGSSRNNRLGQNMLGKFNPSVNRNNSLMLNVAPNSLAQVRDAQIRFQQPNRSKSGNQVNLVRLGNQRMIEINNQYAP